MTTQLNQNLERLKLFCYLELSQEQERKISDLVDSLKDWKPLLFLAESHGLSSLVSYHLRQLSLSLNAENARLLNTLVFRHKQASQCRYQAMAEIDDAFRKNNIDFILMKGVALAPLIYPDAYLRPMGDIDLLIDRQHSYDTHTLMEQLSYEMESSQQGFMKNHHHLPAASKKISGMNMSVEWHLSAIGRDYTTSLVMKHAMQQELLAVKWGELNLYTFSLTTLINQLCHNIAGVEYKIKLINIVDIYQLLMLHKDKLSKINLRKQDFFAYNTIQCLHMHLPLPVCLHEFFDVDFIEQNQKEMIGESMKPVSQTLRLQSSKWHKLKSLLSPSPWWLHMFYAVPINKNLLFIRLVKHPMRLVSWFYQRIVKKNID